MCHFLLSSFARNPAWWSLVWVLITVAGYSVFRKSITSVCLFVFYQMEIRNLFASFCCENISHFLIVSYIPYLGLYLPNLHCYYYIIFILGVHFCYMTSSVFVYLGYYQLYSGLLHIISILPFFLLEPCGVFSRGCHFFTLSFPPKY